MKYKIPKMHLSSPHFQLKLNSSILEVTQPTTKYHDLSVQ